MIHLCSMMSWDLNCCRQAHRAFCACARSTEDVSGGDRKDSIPDEEEQEEEESSEPGSSSCSSGVPLGVVTRFGQDLEQQQQHERQFFCCHAIRHLPPGTQLLWHYSSHEFDAGGVSD